MLTNRHRILFFSCIFGLLMISCNLLAQQQLPQNSVDALYTQAAQTVQAQLTQQAISTQVVQTVGTSDDPLSAATLTAAPTQPQDIKPTATPTVIPSATATLPLPTPLPPTATSVPVLCDHAGFIKDVTIADGTSFSPGAEFTKIWRLGNIGSCTWNSSYSLAYVNGERMRVSKSIPLAGNVRPGEAVDVAIDLLAPPDQGRYRGYWMLSNADGEIFGIGKEADKSFWVEIQVTSPNQRFAYDFAVNMCTATWRSSSDSLNCPGDPDSRDGSVMLLERPELENGRREDESTLWSRPEATRDGWIQGVYPPYKVRTGDHFLAEVGCLADNEACEVVFALDYQVSGGSVKSLGEWYEVYDGAITKIDVDLSGLEGKTIQFILSVTNYGKPSEANPFWLVPSVRQYKPAPTEEVYAAPIEAARRRLAEDLNLAIDKINVVSFELAEWQDSCLGVKLPDEICSEAIIPGYKINMNTSKKGYEAHTNMDASIVYWFEL
jgi:hypothetical protein